MKLHRFWYILIAFALLLMGISLYGIFGPERDYLKTKGTIVGFDVKTDTISDSIEYQTIIDYSINGKEFKNVEYGQYKSSMRIGDEVVVYYDKDNPELIQPSGYKDVPYVVLGASVVFIAISIGGLIRSKEESD